MAKPATRALYSDYCLRQLGHPVIQVNIDDEQLSDRIDEALALFREYHYDAIAHEYFIYQITQDDIDNNAIPITDDVVGIVSVEAPTNSSTNWTTQLGALTKNIHFNIAFGVGIGGCGMLGDYQTFMSRLSDIGMLFSNKAQWDFHQYMNQLIIHDGLDNLTTADDYIMLEIYRAIDSESHGRIWGDRWLCQYGTAIIGRQWGANLSKYDGVQLPGGITLDGDKIYERYNTEALRLEELLEEKYALPIDFMVG